MRSPMAESCCFNFETSAHDADYTLPASRDARAILAANTSIIQRVNSINAYFRFRQRVYRACLGHAMFNRQGPCSECQNLAKIHCYLSRQQIFSAHSKSTVIRELFIDLWSTSIVCTRGLQGSNVATSPSNTQCRLEHRREMGDKPTGRIAASSVVVLTYNR